jgi:hypothetical protein
MDRGLDINLWVDIYTDCESEWFFVRVAKSGLQYACTRRLYDELQLTITCSRCMGAAPIPYILCLVAVLVVQKQQV